MQNILRTKSNSKQSLSLSHSAMHDQLQALKWRNSLIKDMCQKSIQQSRQDDHDRKRKSAESIRELITRSHKRRVREKEQDFKQSYKSIRQMHETSKESIRARLRKNEGYRLRVLVHNSFEVTDMVAKASKLQQMTKKAITSRRSNTEGELMQRSFRV